MSAGRRRHSTPDLIAELARQASPVGRPWRPAAAWSQWAAWTAVIALAAGWTHARPDLALRIGSPSFLAELFACSVVAIGIGWLAVCAAAPDRPLGRGHRALPWGGLVGLSLLAFWSPVDQAAFRGMGLSAWWCAVLTLGFAAGPLVLLLGTLRRGAPLNGRATAGWAGVAAAAMAFGTMRAACPADEALHLVVWHLLPGMVGIVAAVGLGARWLLRWGHSPS